MLCKFEPEPDPHLALEPGNKPTSRAPQPETAEAGGQDSAKTPVRMEGLSALVQAAATKKEESAGHEEARCPAQNGAGLVETKSEAPSVTPPPEGAPIANAVPTAAAVDDAAPPDAIAAAAPAAETATPPDAIAAAAKAQADAIAAANQGVDDEWADWRGCVCGGSYYGEMVGCDGSCDNWFHFKCVGLTRLPRGEWLCQECKGKPKKRRVEKQPAPLPPPPPKKKENPAHSKHERKDREELEKLVERARPLKFERGKAPIDHACSGAGFCALEPQLFAPLQELHGNIVAALRRGKLLQSWEGKGADVRERGFAFLPPTLAKWDRHRLESGGLRFGASHKEGQDFLNDEEANWKSCFHLFPRDVSPEARTALHELMAVVKERIADKYKAYVSMENLVALQPNLHNDARHLPPHLDFPMHDGFGVVIVTIQMAGPPSVIALLRGAEADFEVNTEEKDRERCWTFPLTVGDCYILSGDARNVCDHGVLCATNSGRRSNKIEAPRESLNLRFGLHSPAFANEEVYWQFNQKADTSEQLPGGENARKVPARASRRLAKGG